METLRGKIFAGVMSGTSLDGVDAVVAEFAADGGACALLGATHIAFPSSLKATLLVLQHEGIDEIVRAASAAVGLADLYATALLDACTEAGIAAQDVVAAGVHGQTIRHRPELGWTVQINNAARVAERASMTVVADFRSRDVAAGGQGAPLVPAFHAALFGTPDRHRVVANIGGIANVTDLPPAGVVRGFDTGPGNVLLDLWCDRIQHRPYDAGGAWAAAGNVDPDLLERFLGEPFFSGAPPKSTGRDLFNKRWLDAHLQEARWTGPDVDVQATLTALTARSIADAVGSHCAAATDLLVCGGGARNTTLLRMLTDALPLLQVDTTASVGVAPDHVEAMAFAWLARETLAGRPGNLPAVTGASGLRVLGAIYPR